MNNIIYDEPSGLQIVERNSKYFIRYDAGSHQQCWREDEITQIVSNEFINGTQSQQYEILISLQKQLTSKGINPYHSNWSPNQNQ